MNITFNSPFNEQLEFFRQKLNLPTARWDDIHKAAHDRAFIVAGAAQADLLADLKRAVDKTLSQGFGLEEFRRDFKQIVHNSGWSSWTGQGTQAGEAWRTKVIYQTNMMSSYAAGRYAQLTDPEFVKLAPYWRYVHDDSVHHPRPEHQAWGDSGLTLRYDDPFWETHFPPNGWGCMCRVTPVQAPATGDATAAPEGWDQRDADGNLPGVDKGFDYQPGANTQTPMQDFIDQKLINLEAPIGAALWQALAPVLNREAAAAEFSDWANAIRTSGKTTGETRIIDAISSALLEKMAARGVLPANASIAVRDEDVAHAFRDSKADALPWSWYEKLPINFDAYRAVILDSTDPGKPALLYIYNLPGDTTGKLVLKLDYAVTAKGADGYKRKQLINVLRSGRPLKEIDALNQPGFEIIEGSLK